MDFHKCDAPGCDDNAVFVCGCGRCDREPTLIERYTSCTAHQSVVEKQHLRVRGPNRPVEWIAR